MNATARGPSSQRVHLDKYGPTVYARTHGRISWDGVRSVSGDVEGGANRATRAKKAGREKENDIWKIT